MWDTASSRPPPRSGPPGTGDGPDPNRRSDPPADRTVARQLLLLAAERTRDAVVQTKRDTRSCRRCVARRSPKSAKKTFPSPLRKTKAISAADRCPRMIFVRERCAQRTAAGRPRRGWRMPGSNRCSAHLRRVGRPVSFTAAVADQIVGVVASGVQLSTALSIVVCRGRRTTTGSNGASPCSWTSRSGSRRRGRRARRSSCTK